MVERAEEIYQALLDSGISEEELIQQIKEKSNEFQGFMTKQAILYLIAKENGVNVDSSENTQMINYITEDIIDYNDFAIPISSIVENLRNIVITGRIERVFNIKDFVRKDRTPGRVGSFQICDKSGCIRIVLWNESVEIMENDLFKKGETIQLIGGYSKKGIDDKLEVHLSRQGSIILAPENIVLSDIGKLDIIKSEPSNVSNKATRENNNKQSNRSIQNLHNKEGFIRFISGTVKIDYFKELTLKSGNKSFLLKLILSDESSLIRVNIWGLKAVECVKLISDGDKIKISNLYLKKNSFLDEKELNFTKNSILEVL